jgi:hypothetical protein
MMAIHFGEFGVHVDTVQSFGDLRRELFPDVSDLAELIGSRLEDGRR